MRAVHLCVAAVLWAAPTCAQQAPARSPLFQQTADAAVGKAAASATRQPSADATKSRPSSRRSALFWSGLAVGVAGVTTSTLGLTALRTEHTSTGNAPDATYQACVALKNADPVYATSRCGALKGKNLKLLWGGVALGGAGAALMITGHNTSAQLAPGLVGVYHRWQF